MISGDMKQWDTLIEGEQVSGANTFLYNVPAKGRYLKIYGRCTSIDQFHLNNFVFYEDKY